MAHRRQRCLVSSDEEDEDGNLCEAGVAKKSVTVPNREVVYLPENTSDLQPEGDETGNEPSIKQKDGSAPTIKIKAIASLRGETKLPDGKNTPVQSSTPAKRANENVVVSNVKKAKYTRQATPICDAIMKEYSRRQKLMKQKGISGAELGDLPIQELLRKAKEKVNNEKNSDKAASLTDKTSLTVKSNEPKKNVLEDTNDEAPVIVKQEIIDVKPEVVFVPADNVKQEKGDLVEPSKNTKSSCGVGRGRGRGQGRGRGRGRGRSGSQRNKKWAVSDDDDSDDDPDFDPFAINTQTSRLTRSLRRATTSRQATHTNQEVDACNSQEKETAEPFSSDLTQNNQSKTFISIPKEQAINVAERLKSLAEKIADVLTKEPSPNINIEAEKLLHTTQELIEMQKKTLQASTSSCSNEINIKREPVETLVNVQGNAASLIESSSSASTPSTLQSPAHSLQIYNQLQMHEAALQKKLSENNEQVLNTREEMASPNLPNTTMYAPVSVKEKCTFIMDYFTSYQEVFDEYTANNVITVLSDYVMICMNELTECIKRIKKAQSFKSKDFRQQEVNSAKQSYLNTVLESGVNFFPMFNQIIEKIIKTKTSKALINTLILYISGSLFTKQPGLKSHTHMLRKVLLFMTKAHQYHQQLLNQVLNSPNNVFDNEAKLILLLLKHFQDRNFLKIPTQFLCNFLKMSIEEEHQFQAEMSTFDSALLKHVSPFTTHIDESANDVQRLNHHERFGISPINENNQLRRLNVTAEFMEVLRNEKDENTKRIEQKLDYILNVLSGNAESFGKNQNLLQTNYPTVPQIRPGEVKTDINQPKSTDNFNVRVNLGRRVPNIPTVKINSNYEIVDPLSKSFETSGNGKTTSKPDGKWTTLSQILEKNHVGLDSLFSSYLESNAEKSTTVRIKSEPEDIVESYAENPGIVVDKNLPPVKHEPNVSFFSVTQEKEPDTDLSNEQSLLEDMIFYDSFTEEYNFMKTEKDNMEFDPLS